MVFLMTIAEFSQLTHAAAVESNVAPIKLIESNEVRLVKKNRSA